MTCPVCAEVPGSIYWCEECGADLVDRNRRGVGQ